mgnify:CR=1 FL=1
MLYKLIHWFVHTSVTGRKGADDAFALSSAALSDGKEELMKELRWHYKQYVRESKRKKEKVTEVWTKHSASVHTGDVILYGLAGIQIFSSRAKSISLKLASELYFQHQKIKFVSPVSHVQWSTHDTLKQKTQIFCLFYRYW